MGEQTHYSDGQRLREDKAVWWESPSPDAEDALKFAHNLTAIRWALHLTFVVPFVQSSITLNYSLYKIDLMILNCRMTLMEAIGTRLGK